MRKILMAFVTACLASASLPQYVHAQTAEDKPRAGETASDAAYRLNEDGKKLVAQARYEEALDRFMGALKLFPLSNAIFNVGSMYHQLKRFEEAFPYLQETLRAPLDPRQRQIVLNYLDNVANQLKTSHAQTDLDSNPPGASVSVNGKDLPFKTPCKILVPFGATDVAVTLPGFKPQTVVVNSSTTSPPKPIAVRLDRDEPDAPVSVRCPGGADVFVDGQMVGFELVRTKLLIGNHMIRCGKTDKSKAFERNVQVRAGPNAFEFSNLTK